MRTAADKFMTKQLLGACGLEVQGSKVWTLSELQRRSDPSEYPVFIRPNIGIRSEWARAIADREELDRYVEDVGSSQLFGSDDRFLVESLLVGHEVDVDLVLEAGRVVYGKTSDNFPVRSPFALETGHLMPSLLPDQVQDRVARRVI